MARADSSSKQKVRDHRARLRERGLRPVQLWVLDTKSEAFRAEARRQVDIANHSAFAAEDQAFIDSVSMI